MSEETAPVRNPNGRTPQSKRLAPPFTKETAKEAQLRSARARSENRRIKQGAIDAMRDLAKAKLVALPPKEELNNLAIGILTETLLNIAAGNIKPKTAHEAVALSKAMFEMHRVLEGQPTSITWSADYAKERLTDLAERARKQKLGLVGPATGA